MVFDSQVSYVFGGSYFGCGTGFQYGIVFKDPTVPTETTEELWIHGGELAELQAVEPDSASMYNITWSSGEEENVIYKPAGTYIAGISDMCATAYRTKIVKESVEIDLATCDLESNLNLVTWPTTEAQAQYIDHVIVKRDGMQVGTADYSDGQFIDNIGSGAASRTYTIVAVATDGTECPIVSYPKETIHMSYTLGMNNTIEIGWNTPTGYDLLGYNICEWHEDDGSLTVIDYVGASVTSYTCSQSQFDEGYIVVQGVEAGKNGETRLLSNRSLDLVGIEENGPSTGSGSLTVYPNPAKSAFTVEGTGQMTITDVLGQTVLTREIDGKESVELPQGIYFVN
ncbi:MAG: T9SS type A sorting domain-containing protein [Bacteroidales bacterium]|nr:T9SS type A sorting domain-containing protein [Bacteroidales bacterium]